MVYKPFHIATPDGVLELHRLSEESSFEIRAEYRGPGSDGERGWQRKCLNARLHLNTLGTPDTMRELVVHLAKESHPEYAWAWRSHDDRSGSYRALAEDGSWLTVEYRKIGALPQHTVHVRKSGLTTKPPDSAATQNACFSAG